MLTIVITAPVFCYFTAVGWVSGSSSHLACARSVRSTSILSWSTLHLRRSVRTTSTLSWSTLPSRQKCTQQSVVKSSRLLHECTQHQHSIVKHITPAPRVCAASALRRRACVVSVLGNMHTNALAFGGEGTVLWSRVSVRRLRGEVHGMGSSTNRDGRR